MPSMRKTTSRMAGTGIISLGICERPSVLPGMYGRNLKPTIAHQPTAERGFPFYIGGPFCISTEEIMSKNIDRITGIGIEPETAIFTVSSDQLLEAISEEVDFETITDHELREIIFIVNKALNRMDWRSTVSHAINHLPFGLNQTSIAFDGINPCSSDCPDGMIEGDHCYHQGECKAWEIYEARF